MARGENQKLKLLYMAKIFMECTDEKHGLTTQELIEKLRIYDINAERKSIYTDIEELEKFGLDIITERQGRQQYYILAGREFELAELKLLVDSVQSAKFITEKKSNELIKKLENLVSRHQAKQLQRQVYISGRVKTMNESIYYNVDEIHEAIGKSVTIQFQYYNWNINKKMELRHGGKVYEVSPWALVWDDENYYLVAYDAESDIIKHYRVDKMLKIKSTENPRLGKEKFLKIKMSDYNKKRFSMFDGEIKSVGLEVTNNMVGVMIDRFGKEIMIRKKDDEHIITNVDVAISKQFLCWVLSLGNEVKIISPESVVKEMKRFLEDMTEVYK